MVAILQLRVSIIGLVNHHLPLKLSKAYRYFGEDIEQQRKNGETSSNPAASETFIHVLGQCGHLLKKIGVTVHLLKK